VAAARKYGQGRIVILGFNLTPEYYGVECSYRLLDYLGINRHSYASNRDIHVSERTAEKGMIKGFAFITNLNHEDVLTDIKLTSISPLQIKDQLIPKRSAAIWPLRLSINEFLGEILYMTSEIIKIEKSESKIIINAWGYEGTKGQLALHLSFQPTLVEGAKYSWDEENKILHVTYNHIKNAQIKICGKNHEVCIHLDCMPQPSDYPNKLLSIPFGIPKNLLVKV
jgi:hypothetical protein